MNQSIATEWTQKQRDEYATLFVGIPFETHGKSFDGADCAGLVSLFYNRLGINISLPAYPAGLENSPEDILLPNALANGWYQSGGPPLWGDVIAMRTPAGGANHAAIWIGGDKILHTTIKTGAIISRFSLSLLPLQFEGLLRYYGGVK